MIENLIITHKDEKYITISWQVCDKIHMKKKFNIDNIHNEMQGNLLKIFKEKYAEFFV